MDALTGESRITYDARGLVEPDDTVPNVSEIDGDTAEFDAARLTTRQINLELRELIYERGIRNVTVRNPGAKHSLGVGILSRCRITFDGSLGYFGLGLIDGPGDHDQGPRRLVGVREHDERRRDRRGQRRLADRRGHPRRRPRDQGPRRRAHGHRPEGRHDHHARLGRLDDRAS